MAKFRLARQKLLLALRRAPAAPAMRLLLLLAALVACALAQCTWTDKTTGDTWDLTGANRPGNDYSTPINASASPALQRSAAPAASCVMRSANRLSLPIR